MKSRLFIALVLGTVASACSGGSTSPTVQYPNMLGTWTGSLTFIRSISPPGASNTCTLSWTVTTQNAGQYSGTYQIAGGTVDPCGSAGNVSGSVSADGNVSGLTFSTPFRIVSQCVLSAGSSIPVFSGRVSGTALTAQSTEAIQCTDGSTTSVGSRSLTISVSKQ